MGFANYHRNYIKDYSDITHRLTTLLKKNTSFLGPTIHGPFNKLKSSFREAPTLCHPDFDKPFIIECDASDFCLGAVLSQESDNIRRPIAFLPKKFNASETNHNVSEIELMAILMACRTWRRYLHSSPHRVQVLTDHRNLEFMTKTRKWSRK